MKHRLRLVFALLISLMLPINGMAALQLASAQCAMGESGMAHGASDVHEVHDNSRVESPHPPQNVHDDNGVLCADGQQCQTASLLLPQFNKPPVSGPELNLATYVPNHTPTPTGDSHWRPPRF